jgi:peptide/nickel transport system permease protein
MRHTARVDLWDSAPRTAGPQPRDVRRRAILRPRAARASARSQRSSEEPSTVSGAPGVLTVDRGAAGLPAAPGRGRRWLGLLGRRRVTSIGAAIVAANVVVAALAPALAPWDPLALDVKSRLRGPGPGHWLGTDDVGRDVLSRVLYGARISMMVGGLVVVLAVAAGLVVGLAAGYYRRLDGGLMRVMDGLMAFPAIILAIALMASLGPSLRNVIIALAVVYTPRIARIVRGSVLVVRELPYVEAARSLGASDGAIVLRHVLPNCLSPLIVQGTFIFALAVLGEAALSFLGVGVPPFVPSWGNILAEGRLYIQQAPWLTLFPGLAIMATILGLNLFGDGLRDLLDPKLRGLSGGARGVS